MELKHFAYFFINDDSLRVHQMQNMLTSSDFQRIENCLRQGMRDYDDDAIAEGAMKYLANPDYLPEMRDIPLLEGISNREIIDYLNRLCERCMQTSIPANYRPAICNVIRVIHKMWFRSWYRRK